MTRQNPQFRKEEVLNLREEFSKYVRFWPWFLVSVITCLALGFLYLVYAVPVYKATAAIIINDEDKSGSRGELAAFSELGLFTGMGASSMENEIGILRSQQLMIDVVKNLQLNIQYFLDGKIGKREVYDDKHIEIQVMRLNDKFLEEELQTIEIIEISEEKLRISNEDLNKTYDASYGSPVDIGFAIIVIKKINPSQINNENPFPVYVRFTSLEEKASDYREKIEIDLADKNSSLVVLSLKDQVKEKSRNILDQLILEYNRQAIEDKNLIATNTARFIEDRLSIITEELDLVETGKEDFKESNRLTDLNAESQMYIDNISDFNKKQQEVATQLELSNAMLEYINSDSPSELLPANLGISESGVNSVISEYNELVLERNRILRGSTERNPVILGLDTQLAQIRANVIRSLQRMRSNLLISQDELNRQASKMGTKIAAVPGKEKQFRGIERQQNVKEALYLFLLQKREETSLSLAVTSPKAKIVDKAFAQKDPVFPKPNVVLFGALLLGLFVPFSTIYLKNLFNNKVRNKMELEHLAKNIPVIGEIPRIGKRENQLIVENDRSVFSESFRMLHTNLQYLLLNSKNRTRGEVLFVTSTVKGEGKTFVAFNLALTLANAGKKILVLGADLRNPQLQRYAPEIKNRKGVSEFLIDNDQQPEMLIETSGLHSNLSILPSGNIPPNPSELWRHPRSEKLFNYLRSQFDYIVVDTAPVMLVTDTFLINKFSDLTIYVIRSGFSETKYLNYALAANSNGKLSNLSFILNDVKKANAEYGEKYDYAYVNDKPGKWDYLKRKAAIW